MVEREWREASDMRASRLGLAVVLAAAAVLRFWELAHGIPHALGAQEAEIVQRAFHMMRAGTLNPEFYDYGQLQISLQLGASIVAFLLESTSGSWYSLSDATIYPFYVWGRGLAALAGTLSVFCLYLAVMRWGARHALLAAALLAVVPIHVEYSHLAVADVHLSLFVALALLLSLAALEKGTLTAFAWAGASVGFATATRYPGVLTIVMPFAACAVFRTPSASRGAAAGAVTAGAAAAFLLSAPYTLLDLPAFLDRFAQLASLARQAPEPPTAPAVYYAGALLDEVGWVALLVCVAGIVLGVARVVRDRARGAAAGRWLVALAFTFVYGLFIASRRMAEVRELIPLLPTLALFTASAVISGVSMLRRYELSRAVRSSIIGLLTCAVLVPPAIGAVRYDRDLARDSTQDLAYAWIRQNLSPQAVVVVEADALSIPRGVVDGRGIRELRQKTSDAFAGEGVQYLIASSAAYGRYMAQPQRYREEYLAYTRLFSETREVARFAPARGVPGPELRVLKLVP